MLGTVSTALVLAPLGFVDLNQIGSLALPYYDWDICPGEGCIYREWTALKPVVVYDSWKPRKKKIAGLIAGNKVNALAGMVMTTRPGRIEMYRDLPASQLKKGDILLVYTYQGKGNAMVWFNGSLRPTYDISFATRPDGAGCGGGCATTFKDEGESIWWVKIRLRSGVEGWVDMRYSDFDGTCSFSGPAH